MNLEYKDYLRQAATVVLFSTGRLRRQHRQENL